MTTHSREPSNCHSPEGRDSCKLASGPEHSGKYHVANGGVIVCQCRASPEAPPSTFSFVPQNFGDRLSQSEVSVANLKCQQSEDGDFDADSTVHDTGTRCASIDDLPDELLIKIFSHMSFSELLNVVQRVCTRWRRLSQDFELWADKEYQIRAWNEADCERGTTDLEAIRTFCAAPSLRNVSLQRGASSRVFRALYSNCRRLSVLQMHADQKLSYSVLRNLVEKCSGIHTLKISDELLRCKKFSEAVSNLQHLRVLNLVLHFTKHAPVLRPLADGCPQLTEVDFRSAIVDMEELRYFLTTKRHTLKSIRIRWTMGGRKCVLPLLTVCADSLERLQLYCFGIPRNEVREAFTALGSLKNLRALKMAITGSAPPSSAALAFTTGGLPKLRLLDLGGGYGLDDDTVVAVSRGCPALQELSLRGCHLLTDAAFSQIHQLELLQVLDVSRCRCLSGDVFPYLSGLPRLHTLLMENMEFPEFQPGMSSILELSSLRCLRLNHSLITGVPFEKFPGKLVSLRELNISWCRGDLKATDGLIEQMPNLEIYGKTEADKPAFAAEFLNSDAELPEEENEGNAGLVM